MDSSDYMAKAPFGLTRRARAVWIVTTIAVALLIGVLTLTPTPQVPRSDLHLDKVAHMLAFLSLVFPTALLWPRVTSWIGLLAVLYGGAIEVIQPFAGRSAEFADLLADGVGVGLGIVLGTLTRRWVLARRPVAVD